jgi:hypothetical protein
LQCLRKEPEGKKVNDIERMRGRCIGKKKEEIRRKEKRNVKKRIGQYREEKR